MDSNNFFKEWFLFYPKIHNSHIKIQSIDRPQKITLLCKPPRRISHFKYKHLATFEY